MNPEELQGKVIGKFADLFATIGNPIRLRTLYALRERIESMKLSHLQHDFSLNHCLRNVFTPLSFPPTGEPGTP